MFQLSNQLSGCVRVVSSEVKGGVVVVESILYSMPVNVENKM